MGCGCRGLEVGIGDRMVVVLGNRDERRSGGAERWGPLEVGTPEEDDVRGGHGLPERRGGAV